MYDPSTRCGSGDVSGDPLCDVVVVPLLVLSTDDAVLALSAWRVGVALSYGAAVGVARRPSTTTANE